MKNVTEVRISTMGTFSIIARENYQKLLGLESQQQEIEEKLVRSETNDERLSIEFELMKLGEETNKYVASVIVFSAIAVEAYIYDYAARNLSDSFVQNYLDKLDPMSKWVIIPRLVTGKELSRNHRWFELLKKLIQERNRIIHHKSSSPPVEIDDAITYFKKLQLSSVQTYNTAKEAIELLDILPNEMREIDHGEMVWISGHLAPDSDNPFKFLEDL